MTASWDPRPQWADGGIQAWRCADGHVTAERVGRCPECRSSVSAVAVEPVGEVWSWTVAHLEPEPYGLAYVDLHDGPRVLARFAPGRAPAVGARVAVLPGADGDLELEGVA